MPYEAEISRRNPTLWVMLVDQGSSERGALVRIASEANELLRNLVMSCAKAHGIVDYFFTSLLGYGNEVSSRLATRGDMIPISVVAQTPIRVENRKSPNGDGGFLEYQDPIWFEPTSESNRSMCSALSQAIGICKEWTMCHQDSFPPIVINIVGGEPSDGDPQPLADRLKHLSTSDGNILLFDEYVTDSSYESLFTCELAESLATDQFANVLFNMSSMLPLRFRVDLEREGLKSLTEESRCFTHNASLESIISLLRPGARPPTKLTQLDRAKPSSKSCKP
jgi:hypothetical protein